MTKRNPFKPNENGIMLGAYIPSHLADYLRLYAVYENVSVSVLLRNIITAWEKEHPSANVIQGVLISRVMNEWKYRLSNGVIKDTNTEWEQYKKEVSKTLRKRKVDTDNLNLILACLDKERSQLYG